MNIHKEIDLCNGCAVYFFNYCNQMDLNQSSMAACATARRAIGTRKGEQDA